MSDDFFTWNDGDSYSREKAISSFSETHKSYDSISRGSYRDYIDIEPSRSVKTGFTSNDYYAFRPSERIPTKDKRIIKMCMDAYDRVGIVRNIIDLMGDFCCQGIDLVHENKSVEKFYKQWFKKVSGKERSERFANLLYKTGNPVVYRSYAKITPKVEKYVKSLGNDIKVTVPNFKDNVIPWRYNFLNPTTIEVKDEKVSMILSKRNYAVNTGKFLDNFRDGSISLDVVKTLPENVKRAIKDRESRVELDPERLSIYHYKKDDWQMWARPLVYAILDDIVMLEKMKLADMAALDGAISNVRLWTVGNLDHKILPSKGIINKIRDILSSNTGGGTIELVFGPEISFTESNSQVYKFLGSEKYQAVLSSIYAGLGVPPTLTGMADNGGGFTNNFISLKTMIERLRCGRDLLTEFWEGEIENVRRSMGFRKPARVVYEQMNLSDEAAEKNLLIQLVDRDIISQETLLERFKEIPEVEKLRIRRESKDRDRDKIPPKASPFHNANHDQEVEKLKVQKDEVKNNGRPPNKKDETPRKKRRETPRSQPGVADIIQWSTEAFDKLSSISKSYLDHLGKNNLRQLTKAEAKTLEDIRLCTLFSLPTLEQVSDKSISKALSNPSNVPQDFKNLLYDEGITFEKMSLDNYRKSVLSAFIAYKLKN